MADQSQNKSLKHSPLAFIINYIVDKAASMTIQDLTGREDSLPPVLPPGGKIESKSAPESGIDKELKP